MKSIAYCILISIISLSSYGQTKNPIDDNRLIRVPVVFHVLHSNTEENISDSLILNELNDLNSDFSRANDMSMLDSDFESLVGNPNIEFYLYDTLFQTGGKKGINRIAKSRGLNRNTLLVSPVTTVNVFIADQGNSSGILSDRINLNYRKIGLHTHVLTHEMGHWLGLYHIWGKAGHCGWFKALFSSHDDQIDDTPKQFRCTDLKFSKNCPPKKRISYKGHKTLYNNFMDYSGCRCMFTVGQATKMRNNIIERKPTIFN